MRYSIERLVMISTDKAVNPSNVMGASKRVAEMLVYCAAKQSGCPYVVVRFGNVLGSRGSVVATFKKQIAAGGPVTVTDLRAKRYFMTISEAVQLVLQASTLGQGGEVFVLDMGEPVTIDRLARDMITLSGFEPETDIAIEYIGLRPGDKLIEELFTVGEHHRCTSHEKIFVAGNPMKIDSGNLDAQVGSLLAGAKCNDMKSITNTLCQLVPGYLPTVHNSGSSVDGSKASVRSMR
jgi:FlaA1/EpsC-like NDP-sugar epimerase